MTQPLHDDAIHGTDSHSSSKCRDAGGAVGYRAVLSNEEVVVWRHGVALLS